MTNIIEQTTIDTFSVFIPAPCVSSKRIKIVADKKNGIIKIEATAKTLDWITEKSDLDIKETITVPKSFDVSKTTVKVSNGAIIISVGTTEDIIKIEAS